MSAGSTFETVLKALTNSARVVVVSHTNPDADAYGSSCGLALGLSALGKSVVVHNESGYVQRYRSIPGASSVIQGAWAPLGDGDVLVVCDCGALERVGDSLIAAVRAAPFVVNIDHHNANTRFGYENFVIEGASSSSELIFDLLRGLERMTGRADLITSECAAALLAGIIGDTGSFRYSSTAPSTFLAAYELMSRGARPDVLGQELFGNASLAAVKLQAEAISGIQLHNEGRFAEVVVSSEMVARHGASILDADSLAERARDIEGVQVSVLYKQDVDLWRVSLRARQGGVDVSEIAQGFGGGGHKPAAAFRWRQEFAVLQTRLREAISRALSSGK